MKHLPLLAGSLLFLILTGCGYANLYKEQYLPDPTDVASREASYLDDHVVDFELEPTKTLPESGVILLKSNSRGPYVFSFGASNNLYQFRQKGRLLDSQYLFIHEVTITELDSGKVSTIHDKRAAAAKIPFYLNEGGYKQSANYAPGYIFAPDFKEGSKIEVLIDITIVTATKKTRGALRFKKIAKIYKKRGPWSLYTGIFSID